MLLFEDIALDPVNANKRTSGINITKISGARVDREEIADNLTALFDEGIEEKTPDSEELVHKHKKRKKKEQPVAAAQTAAPLADDGAVIEEVDDYADEAPATEQAEEKLSAFDGKWYQLLGVNWLCNFVTLITLSFGQYWAHCYKERWFCKHRTVSGEKLSFDGKAGQYFGKRILWLFLTVITFGVYVFWLKIKTIQWTVSHTHIAV